LAFLIWAVCGAESSHFIIKWEPDASDPEMHPDLDPVFHLAGTVKPCRIARVKPVVQFEAIEETI